MLRRVCSSGRSLLFTRSYTSAGDFEAAQKNVQKLPREPDVDIKLKLYGLFKQASMGDVEGSRPGAFDFAGRAKYDAWKENAGISKEQAQEKYVELVSNLLKEANVDLDASASTLSASTGANNKTSGLETTKFDNIFKITLNRPDKFNAITWDMYDAFSSALEEASKERDTRITVITGTGSYYCSGNDLSNFAVKSPAEMKPLADRAGVVLERFVRAFIEHEKPLVVLVNGPAIGISVTVMGLADLVIASAKATFQTPFSSLGQSPEGCSSYTFPLLMGTSKASEVLLFGKKLSAEEALERNLVAKVIPDAQFTKETERLVAEYAKLPPESLRLNKQLVRNMHREQLLRANTTEVEFLKQRWLSKECAEALMKFMSRKNK